MTDRDDILNKLLDLFKLTDNDIVVVSYIIDEKECDYELCVDTLRDMGYGVGLFDDEPEVVVDEGLQEINELFHGHEFLTQSVLTNAYKTTGDVETTINMLFNIGRDDEAVERLRNGSKDEIRALEASLKRRQDEQFLAEQRRLEEEIQRDKEQIVALRREFEATQRALENTNEPDVDAFVDFSPMKQPEIVDSLTMDEINEMCDIKNTINHPKTDEIVNRLKETYINVQKKTEEKQKREEEFSKCTLAVNVGESRISVTYHLSAAIEPNNLDWIGMYTSDSPNRSYLVYQRIPESDQRSGTLFFDIPQKQGLFQFRFFPKGSYLHICSSQTIYLGPELDITATYENGIASFTWGVLNDETISSGDWFGLYRVGSNDYDYLANQYLDQNKKTGFFNTALRQGAYEVRFFPKQCGYVHTQSSDSFIVEGSDVIENELGLDSNGRIETITSQLSITSVARHTSDWVGLFRNSASNKNYLEYKYLPIETTTVVFNCPRAVGSYDIRFFSGTKSRYEDLVRSEFIDVNNSDSVRIEITEGLLNISWDIHSVQQTTYDWIGLYKAEETNNKQYLKDVYVDLSQNSTLLPLPHPGYYEVRYFSSIIGKYESFRKSSIFKVD